MTSCMSVRENVEADTVARTGLDRHQARAADRTSTAKHSQNGTQGVAESNFCDSLQAHFDTQDSEDAARKAIGSDAGMARSSSSPTAVMKTSDCADLTQGSAHAPADGAGAAEMLANNKDKNCRSQLVAPAGVQKRFSIIREPQTQGVAVGGSVRKSTFEESTSNLVNGFDAPPSMVALSSQAAAIASPDPSGLFGPVYSLNDRQTAQVYRFLKESAKASSPLSNLRATAAHEISSGAWPDSSTDVQSAVTQAVEPT